MSALLIAKLVGIAGVALLLFGVVMHFEGVGRDKQKADDAPIIKAAENRATVAEKNVETAQADLEALRAAYAAQDEAIHDLGVETAALQVQAKAALAAVAAAEKRAQYAEKVSRLNAIVAGPPLTGDTCAEADSILRALAADRLRD